MTCDLVVCSVGFSFSNSMCVMYERAYCIMEREKAKLLEELTAKNPTYLTSAEHDAYTEAFNNLENRLVDSGILTDATGKECWLSDINSCKIIGDVKDGIVLLDGEAELKRIVFNNMT